MKADVAASVTLLVTVLVPSEVEVEPAVVAPKGVVVGFTVADDAELGTVVSPVAVTPRRQRNNRWFNI